jgi:hypothetical protein
MSLLSIDTNAKTVKGQKFGFLTGILYLAPHTIASSVNLCPMSAAAQCQKACLYTAGRGAFTSIQNARINKTLKFLNDQENFMNTLVQDIARLSAQAKKKGLSPLVRLNGTSDIVWEQKGFRINEKTATYLAKYHSLDITGYHKNIMEIFPNVQFYDYTKLAGRFNREIPSNYDLTFSYSGVETYAKQVSYAVKHGARIAVVFRDQNFPSSFLGMEVVNGDNSRYSSLRRSGGDSWSVCQGQSRERPIRVRSKYKRGRACIDGFSYKIF